MQLVTSHASCLCTGHAAGSLLRYPAQQCWGDRQARTAMVGYDGQELASFRGTRKMRPSMCGTSILLSESASGSLMRTRVMRSSPSRW